MNCGFLGKCRSADFVDGKRVLAQPAEGAAARSVLLAGDNAIVVFEHGSAFAFYDHPPVGDVLQDGGDTVRSPMPGRVIAVAAFSSA